MRKYTGYIGALVIVVSLAFTILSGFVLNVTNDQVSKDQYDLVTDVSGLYSHTQDKTYIDYNPAKNYTGYSGLTSYINPPGDGTYKSLTNSTVVLRVSDQHVIIDGVDQGKPNFPYYGFICDYAYCYYESGTNLTVYAYGIPTSTNVGDVTISISLPDIYITYQTTSTPYTVHISDNSTLALAYNTIDSDYYLMRNTTPPAIPMTVYMENEKQCITSTVPYPYGVCVGNDWISTSQNPHGAVPTVYNNVIQTGTAGNGINTYSINNLNTDGKYNWGIFYPKSFIIDNPGINYTVSNRANNYPMITGYDDTYSRSLTLSSGLTQTTKPINTVTMEDYKDYTGTSGGYNNYNVYSIKPSYASKLSDIIPSLTLDAGTTSVIFTNKSGNYITTPAYQPDGSNYYTSIRCTGQQDVNAVWFINPDTDITTTYGYPEYAPPNDNTIFGNADGKYNNTNEHTQKLIYNVANQTVDFYIDDVRLGVYSPSDITVVYGGSCEQRNYSMLQTAPFTHTSTIIGSTATTPALTSVLYYTGYTNMSSVYMDPTAGVSIPNNTVTQWSNGYENSDIQILFRINDQGIGYSNTITVGNDTVLVYTGGTNFYVQINDNPAVTVGNWRNIVLDLDVLNGQVRAYPVKTFNNYTNVTLYDTDIYIGELSDKQTVSVLEFENTNNSFTFGVYNTKVFMDTYGVVMIDPSLDPTLYFTDLNGFYKLDLNRFSIIGDSITINGQTYSITNGSITVNDQVIKINDLSIIYKGGECSLIDNLNDIEVSLGAITDYTVSMTGTWYFTSTLYRGSIVTGYEYTWHIEDFIINNGQFVVIYLGLMAVSYVVARRFCSFSISDYFLMIASIIVILGVQVIA